MNESWKPIEGHPNYRISNLGRIKSFARRSPINGLILKLGKQPAGYLCISMGSSRNRKTQNVHRLVAKAFIENPHGKPQVDHINGIKTDNRAINLRWVTFSENQGAFNWVKPGKETPRCVSLQKKYGTYRVAINLNRKPLPSKCFSTPQEAVSYRNELLTKHGITYASW